MEWSLALGFRNAGYVYDDENRLVATNFFCLFLVPVLPLGGMLIQERKLFGSKSVDIPLMV